MKKIYTYFLLYLFLYFIPVYLQPASKEIGPGQLVAIKHSNDTGGECTTGFAVKGSALGSGTGLLIAGHCGTNIGDEVFIKYPDGTISELIGNFIIIEFGGEAGADYGVISLTNGWKAVPRISFPPYTYYVTSYASFTIDAPLLLVGAKSNKLLFGHISDVGQTFRIGDDPSTAQTVKHLDVINTKNDTVVHGDSGGPVFFNYDRVSSNVILVNAVGSLTSANNDDPGQNLAIYYRMFNIFSSNNNDFELITWDGLL